jgi:hydrogenase maturation protease
MRTLIAGLGNIFESDDGFGVAVAQSLLRTEWPDGVELHDYGIRGIHLAYQLLTGYDLVVIVDAVTRSGVPGTLYLIDHVQIEQGQSDGGGQMAEAAMLDGHDLGPDAVLALVPELGGTLGRVVIVGCEPASLGPGMELSADVVASVAPAAALVIKTVREAYEYDTVRIGGD